MPRTIGTVLLQKGAIVQGSGMKSNAGNTIRRGANLGSVLRQSAILRGCHQRFCSSRLRVTRGVMPASRSTPRRVGCYTQAMPTFTETRWVPPNDAARPDDEPTNGWRG